MTAQSKAHFIPQSTHAVSTPRCKACQLQLCKSRCERPHTGLKARPIDEGTTGSVVGGVAVPDTEYDCTVCGAILVCSSDPSRPGWTHRG